MAGNSQQTQNDPNALTPGELAYMNSGGDDTGLVQEGLIGTQRQPVQQQAEPEPDTQIIDSRQQAQAQEQPQQQVAEEDDDGEPELDPKSDRPKQRGRWVNKKALDEARGEIKELRAQLGQKSEQWARVEERFKTFQEALNAPEPEAEPEPEPDLPDPEQDIIGFNRGVWDRTQRGFQTIQERLEQLGQQLGGINEQTAAQRQTQEMVSAYAADARAFVQKQPDFMEAYQFLIRGRDSELQAAGYDDPAERQRLIVADEQALVARSLQGKASPAERLYALAKARGYAPKQTNGAGNGQQQQQQTNGTQQQNAQQQPNVTDEIARAQAGQNAALSLSNAGGTRAPSGLTLDEIANMSDDQFREFARRQPKAFAAFEALMGKGQQ